MYNNSNNTQFSVYNNTITIIKTTNITITKYLFILYYLLQQLLLFTQHATVDLHFYNNNNIIIAIHGIEY